MHDELKLEPLSEMQIVPSGEEVIGILLYWFIVDLPVT